MGPKTSSPITCLVSVTIDPLFNLLMLFSSTLNLYEIFELIRRERERKNGKKNRFFVDKSFGTWIDIVNSIFVKFILFHFSFDTCEISWIVCYCFDHFCFVFFFIVCDSLSLVQNVGQYPQLNKRNFRKICYNCKCTLCIYLLRAYLMYIVYTILYSLYIHTHTLIILLFLLNISSFLSSYTRIQKLQIKYWKRCLELRTHFSLLWASNFVCVFVYAFRRT